MHRFFLTGTSLVPGSTVDITSLAHQLRTVLRLRPGAQILLLDGEGFAYPTEIRHLARAAAQGLVLGREPVASEPPVQVTLYQCSLKADKFEWVLQKGTELGVARFVPVISQRSIVRPAQALLKKYRRWRAIVREAAEQSGRGRLPTLAQPLSWAEAVANSEGLRLLPWEEAADSVAAQGLGRTVAGQTTLPEAGIGLLIGPEGGVASDEMALARANGWQIVSLGPRILRAETAAIVAVTVTMSQCGGLE